MNWFEEQLKYRREKDRENFEEALDSIANAVMGRRLTEAFDSKEAARSAIEEILNYYQLRAGKGEAPPEIETIEDHLDYYMRPHGIMYRSAELDRGWYHDAVGPMLGTMKEDGRAVALIPGKFSGYIFLDLKSGKYQRVDRKNQDLFDREVICFYPSLPQRPLKIRDLFFFMSGQRTISDRILYFALTGGAALIGLLSPLFSKWLFGPVLRSGSSTVLMSLACFMVCFTICSLFITISKTLVISKMGTKQSIAVQSAVMSRIMSLPASFFKDYASGDLTQRAEYIQNLSDVIMTTVGSLGITSLFSLIYIGQIFAFAPALAVPAFVVMAVTVAVIAIAMALQVRITREKMLLTAHTSGLLYSTISGIQKIKLAGAEKRMFSRWAKHYSEEAALEYNPPTFLKLSQTLALAVSLGGTLVMYYLAVKTGVSTDNYYAFNTAYAMVSSAFMSLAAATVTLADIRPTLEMAKPIMDAQPETSEGRETVKSLKGRIELSNISFRYDKSMPYVIENLSLRIKPGEYVAIAGPTGCGKSTLLRLLSGFEVPEKGAIFYDNKDMSKLDLRTLRRNIGTVMQEGRLFLGDIYSNIIIAAPDLTLEDAWEAAEIASIADDIREMPMEMHTVISEGQGGISGGQKQRLMIARAIAPKPKILMFDEATSALDNITQRKISEAIDSLDCTRIIVAHRLSTIKHADRIIYLDEGKIIEDGTYEELIAKNGAFADLVRRQRVDAEEE